MKRTVGVFGVPGIGKSTLLRLHTKARPVDRYVTGSDVVKAIIAPATTRDLDAWSPARQAAVRRESIRRLESLRAETAGFLMVSGHFSLRNRHTGVIEPILTDEDHAFFGALVLLDGDADFVLRLSTTDSRRRHGQSLDAIQQHIEFERALAHVTARRMGVPLCVIAGRSTEARQAALLRYLDQLPRDTV